MPHLVLIDGPNHVYRAFHAIRSLSNSKGLPTNAVFGYVQMLRKVLKDIRPTHVAVAFDPKDGTFRNEIYPDYKAHRPPMPENLERQWPWVFKVTRAFRIPLIQIDNYEADDVIATLARQARARGWDVTIVSTDKDLMQLICDGITMIDTMKGIQYGPKEVRERWGVGPEEIQDLLALTGDTSDNIPGIPGIGPKTAVQLLHAYGNLENVLEHAHEIPQAKRRESLLRHADDARLSYRLVELEDHVPLPVKLDDLKLHKPDAKSLEKLFQELEFRRFMEEFADLNGKKNPGLLKTENKTNERIDHLVNDAATFEKLLATLQSAHLIALDTETTSLAAHDAELVGISFATREGEAWYIPIGHRAGDLLAEKPRQLPLDHVLQHLRPALEDKKVIKCGHNLKYDLQVLRRVGIELAGIRFDSMLLAYCLAPGLFPPKLDAVAAHYLGYQCISYEEVVGKGAKQICFADVPLEKAVPYACEDAEVALRLSQDLSSRLEAEGRLQRHDDIELPLSRVLADMEWKGAKLDTALLARLSEDFGKRIEQLEARIHLAAGEAFNIHSPKQLGEILFEKLKIPGGKKTKSGQWATGQDVLEKLAAEHEVPRLILEVRALSKLKSTYTDALPKLVHPQTGRVHTSYNQAITSTGRLSSSDPNLQNIPIRTDVGREIRKAFIAEPGFVLISADYSQIELRLMAHFSKDPVLRDAFLKGEDIHAATAAVVNDVPLERVTGEMRRRAKIINFGILYGMSAFGLAKQLGVGRNEAQTFIDTYFDKYRQVRAFMEQTLEQARAKGYVETLLGHRVLIPEINERNGMRRAYAERTAINAPLQGSAADIIKVAMIRLHKSLKKNCPEAAIILQVHDELVIEAPRTAESEVTALLRQEMEHAVKLDVPLTVDIGSGCNWFEAHRL